MNDQNPTIQGEIQNILTMKVPFRVFILNFLQLLGILALALALPSPDTAAFLALLPAAIVAHIHIIAAALLGLKPAINLLGDWIDNGKIDGSWNIQTGEKAAQIILLCLVITGLTSCAWYKAHQTQIAAVSNVALSHIETDVVRVAASALVNEAQSGFSADWKDSLMNGAYQLPGYVFSSGNIQDYLDAWNPAAPAVNAAIAKTVSNNIPADKITAAMQDPSKAQALASQVGVTIGNSLLSVTGTTNN